MLHELERRQELSGVRTDAARARLAKLRVAPRSPAGLHARSWRTATELGWAKTYDAEYVALALLAGRPLLTVDARMVAVAGRLVEIRTPADL